MPFLSLTHRPQEASEGCLAACAQMVLEQLGISVSQQELNRILGLTPLGIPYPNIQRLKQYGVEIVLQQGDELFIRQTIDRGIAPIVFLLTLGLPHWQTETQHALVVIGYDEQNVYVHDPVFREASKPVPWNGFLIGWIEFDMWCAFIPSRPRTV